MNFPHLGFIHYCTVMPSTDSWLEKTDGTVFSSPFISFEFALGIKKVGMTADKFRPCARDNHLK